MNIILIPHLPTLFGRRYNLAKTLASQGHEIHFITWDMPYPLNFKSALKHLCTSLKGSEYKKEGFTVHKIRRLPFFWPVLNGIFFKYQIRKFYRAYDVDVILTQSYTNEVEPPLDLPLVYDMNDDHAAFAEIYGSAIYKAGFRILGVRKTIRKLASHAKLVTYVSAALGKMAREMNDNSMFLPNGVDDLAYTMPIKPKKAGVIELVYISNFGPWSKIDQVILAVEALVSKGNNIRLNVVGEGTNIAGAKSLVRQHKLGGNINFYGHISDRVELFKIIDHSDLCINISEKNKFRDAAFPIKVLEYSVRGKRVISSDLDEVRALKLPNVYICKNISNVSALSRGIEAALSMKVDTKKVINTISNKYRWESISSQLVTQIESVLEGRDVS